MTDKQTEHPKIAPPRGRLGVLLPGLGAVATTFVAGVEAVRRGFAQPIGSITQMGTIRLGKRTEARTPLIRDFVPLANLSDLEFAAWDPIPDDGLESARVAGVLGEAHLRQVGDFLATIKPLPAVFSQDYVKKLKGENVKRGANKRELAEALRADIRRFKEERGCDRLVMVWCASTEVFLSPGPVHQSIEAFEEGLEKSDPGISPSMIYAYAAIQERVPFANGAPNLTVD
ncbi:MAG: inositol-3-phosphate synthase, partial [Gemmatimonas sp. SM23_52]